MRYHPDTVVGAAASRGGGAARVVTGLDRMKQKGTYVYGVIAADRRPPLTRVPVGLPGAGSVRLLDVDEGLFIAVADLPLDKYNAAAISSGLANLDWVSRIAVAHEAVVESFVASKAVLPMKLFTIFTSDAQYSSTEGFSNTILRPSASESSTAICSWSISTGPESGMVVPKCRSGLFRSAAMARP